MFFFFPFSGLHLYQMEIPRPGVESQLQMPAYTTAVAMQDWRLAFNRRHSSQQHQILNPLSKARNQIHILLGISGVHNPLSQNGNSQNSVIYASHLRGHLTHHVYIPPIALLVSEGLTKTSSLFEGFLFLFWFLFLVFFRAATMAYGDSQARDLIRAVAAALHHSHSNAKFKPHLQPTTASMTYTTAHGNARSLIH